MALRGKQGPRGKTGRTGPAGINHNYIDAKTFKDFCTNQDKLIDILNHRMTSIEKNMIEIKTDVAWTKKLLFAILGVVVVSFVTIIIKSMIGGI